MWSRSMAVSTETAGVMALVASSLPPRPVSQATTSTGASAKQEAARAVVSSKKVGAGSQPAVTFRSRVNPSATAWRDTGSPSTRMRSRKLTRCGEVNKPLRLPAARLTASTIAHTEPLPLVPATWTKRALWEIPSRPSACSSRWIFSSPSLIPVNCVP